MEWCWISARIYIERIACQKINPNLRKQIKCGELQKKVSLESERVEKLTRSLNAETSSSVRVSALAITGIRLTLVCRRRMTSMSRGFRE